MRCRGWGRVWRPFWRGLVGWVGRLGVGEWQGGMGMGMGKWLT